MTKLDTWKCSPRTPCRAAIVLLLLSASCVAGNRPAPSISASTKAAENGSSPTDNSYGGSYQPGTNPFENDMNPTDVSSNTPFKIGSANFEPVYWRLNETISKVCEFVKAAGENNVKLLLFPEGAVSGYPWFNWWAATWDMDNNERINQLFIENSPMIGPDGGDLKPVLECAKEAGVNVALPINERDNKGSKSAIFNTIVFISLNGEILGRHRKTTPSYTERFWWSFGNGDDLVVVDMPEVGRVCGLLCWENYMTLARYTLMAQGCEFWMAPTQDIGPHWVGTAQMIAREARAYVISTTQMFRPEVAAMSEIGKTSNGQFNWTDQMLKSYEDVAVAHSGVGEYMMDGQSLIADPDGKLVAGPVYSDGNYGTVDGKSYTIPWAKNGCEPLFKGVENQIISVGQSVQLWEPCQWIDVSGKNNAYASEGILAANASRGVVQRKKLYMDSVGNYARPDIWSVTWHNQPKDVMFTDVPIAGLHPETGLWHYDSTGKPYDREEVVATDVPLKPANATP